MTDIVEQVAHNCHMNIIRIFDRRHALSRGYIEREVPATSCENILRLSLEYLCESPEYTVKTLLGHV